MDGDRFHENMTELFPGAASVECQGDAMWAMVTFADGSEITAKCPGCAREKLAAKVTAFIPPRFRAPIELLPAVANWVDRGRKAQGLYLAGQVGTGKTHTAWAATVAWCLATGTDPQPREVDRRTGPNVIVARLTDLLDDLRPGDDARQRVRDCQSAALLVIDDLGAEKPSEWTQERLYSVVDHRYANCLPLIVTGNLPPSKLAEQAGDRVASRLAEMCEVVPMTGADRRRKAS